MLQYARAEACLAGAWEEWRGCKKSPATLQLWKVDEVRVEDDVQWQDSEEDLIVSTPTALSRWRWLVMVSPRRVRKTQTNQKDEPDQYAGPMLEMVLTTEYRLQTDDKGIQRGHGQWGQNTADPLTSRASNKKAPCKKAHTIYRAID